MYLEKPLPCAIGDSYDLVCLRKDEFLILIPLFVELVLVHHTDNKSEKHIYSFHTLFGAMNTTQIILETKLSNFEVANFVVVNEYISRFKILK